MAYCRNCGMEIHNEAVICPHCGVSQKQVTDNGGFGYGVLGCCVPVAGIILYFIWKDEKPKSSKAAGIGFLISMGIGSIIAIVYVLIVIIMIIMMSISMA